MKKILLSLLLMFPSIVLAKNDYFEVELSSCIDGDTANFIYQEEVLKARFLSIDTPETKHPTKQEEPFGKDASDYTCESLTKAKKIELEFDDNSDEKDKYDRYLVWVFVDGNNLQFELVSKGLAKVEYIYGEYKYLDELYDLERIAKQEQIGIWGDYIEQPDYTFFYIIGGIILIIIFTIIINYSKNKGIKKIARQSKTEINKNLKKLIKKL